LSFRRRPESIWWTACRRATGFRPSPEWRKAVLGPFT